MVDPAGHLHDHFLMAEFMSAKIKSYKNNNL